MGILDLGAKFWPLTNDHCVHIEWVDAGAQTDWKCKIKESRNKWIYFFMRTFFPKQINNLFCFCESLSVRASHKRVQKEKSLLEMLLPFTLVITLSWMIKTCGGNETVLHFHLNFENTNLMTVTVAQSHRWTHLKGNEKVYAYEFCAESFLYGGNEKECLC